jgi:ribosomal protein S18 acetylase RimI-like enzyme
MHMQNAELAQLAITRVEAASDADLEAMVEVRRRATPDDPPMVENLRFNLESRPDLVYLVARLGRDPVACGYVEAWSSFAAGDVVVVPDRRRRGIGSAVLADISARARAFGKDSIQGEVRENDAESRAFLERRGFVQVGAEKAVVLDLEGSDAPAVDPPSGVRIVSRVEEPDLLEQMYVVGVQADEDIPGQEDVQTFEQWRAQEIDKPSRRPEFCFIALAGDEVVGYAALQIHGAEAFHGLTATRRDWRRRGVATALKRAEIAAAKRSGFGRLVTESEERNEPMRRLNEKLGFVPAPELSMVVMRGPV